MQKKTTTKKQKAKKSNYIHAYEIILVALLAAVILVAVITCTKGLSIGMCEATVRYVYKFRKYKNEKQQCRTYL